MNMKKVTLPNELICSNDLNLIINQATKEEFDIENMCFEHTQQEKILCDKLEFKSCHFKNIKSIQSTFTNVYFINCIFENCDFSNTNFSESNFHITAFLNCNLVGSNFSECHFQDTLIKDSSCRYGNFSFSNFKDSSFHTCNLSNSSMQENTFLRFCFEECNLSYTNFFKTSLATIDLSSCIIDGIVANQSDLKGVIVDMYQAVELTKLFGIVIK